MTTDTGGTETDAAIQARIAELQQGQRVLRERGQRTELTDADRQRLGALQEQIDQQWDLLRQRRAKEEFGQDPSTAAERPVDEVEGYRS